MSTKSLLTYGRLKQRLAALEAKGMLKDNDVVCVLDSNGDLAPLDYDADLTASTEYFAQAEDEFAKHHKAFKTADHDVLCKMHKDEAKRIRDLGKTVILVGGEKTYELYEL